MSFWNQVNRRLIAENVYLLEDKGDFVTILYSDSNTVTEKFVYNSRKGRYIRVLNHKNKHVRLYLEQEDVNAKA